MRDIPDGDVNNGGTCNRWLCSGLLDHDAVGVICWIDRDRGRPDSKISRSKRDGRIFGNSGFNACHLEKFDSLIWIHRVGVCALESTGREEVRTLTEPSPQSCSQAVWRLVGAELGRRVALACLEDQHGKKSVEFLTGIETGSFMIHPPISSKFERQALYPLIRSSALTAFV